MLVFGSSRSAESVFSVLLALLKQKNKITETRTKSRGMRSANKSGGIVACYCTHQRHRVLL